MFPTERGLTESIGWARAFRGFAAYQANDLTTAERDFTARDQPALRLPHGAIFPKRFRAGVKVYAARGDFDQAREIVDSLAVYALEVNNLRVAWDADAFRAWLASETGAPC